MTSDKEMNADFAGKYPKVTPEHIQQLMDKVIYIANRVGDTTTTLVISYIKIGDVDFTLAHTTMACVDKRNFDLQKGIKYCTEKCARETRNKLWELEGYLLANHLVS